MSKTVLMIDDDWRGRASVGDALKTKVTDINFVEAGTLEEGWERFEAAKPDIIVLDGNIDRSRGIDGTLELLGRIKATGFAGPIVAFSSQYNDTLLRGGCTHAAEFSDMLIGTVLGLI